jgi:type IV pilus assembly protein PilE
MILGAISRSRGVTLMELLVVLVVAAFLAAVALPSYLSILRKGRRSDAVDASVAVLQAQERYRANNPSYAPTLAALGQASTSAAGQYGLALLASTAVGYQLTLLAVNGSAQAGDTGCTALTVTVSNGSPSYAPSTCWSR